MLIQLLVSIDQGLIIDGDTSNKRLVGVCLSSWYYHSLCLEVLDKHFDLLIGALCILDGNRIFFLKLRPFFICPLDHFDYLILREVYMLALIQTLDAICWLSLMVGTGLLLALIENLLSVA